MKHMEQYEAICKKLKTLYAKNYYWNGRPYHDAIVEEGMGIARIQLNNRVNRFRALSKFTNDPSDESIRNTLMELADYAIMTLMELESNEKDSNPENKTVSNGVKYYEFEAVTEKFYI